MVPKEKMEQLTEQYRATLRGLTGSAEAWQRFLRLAAYQYKYSFPEQVLIYAQRPTATACAPIELWNRRFHRFVSRGSRGIALFTERNGRAGIRYVFDVGDTVGREPFALWQVPDGMESLVADALEVRLDGGEQFPQAVFSACMNAVEENDGDYFENLCQSRADSRLAAYPQPELQSRFRTALWMSVSESVMIRLGMDPRMVSPADYFSVVTDFNTPETVNLLGVATSDLSEQCLRTVERAVLANRTFDKPPAIGYDKGEQKSTEQGGEHHDLHEPERIPTPEPDAPAAEETPARQVRENAPELSQSPPQGNLHDAPDRSETLGTPLGDRADGEEAGPANGGTDGGGAGGERADETAEPDALDADDEQSESGGGGDRSERPDLHIIEEEPNGRHDPEPNGIMPVSLPEEESEQMALFSSAEQRTGQFQVTQEVIDALLRFGGATKGSPQRIYGFYRRANDQKENIAFLKSEYEKDFIGLIVGDRKAAASWDENGIRIAEGESAVNAENAVLLSWETVDHRIRQLLEAGQYLSQSEAEKAEALWEDHVAERITNLYRDYFECFPRELTKQFPHEIIAFPEQKAYFRGVLNDSEKLGALLTEIRNNISRIQDYPPRFRYSFKPNPVLQIAKTFLRDPVDFPDSDETLLRAKRFITRDQIDRFLIREGSSFENGKFRIYSFFLMRKEKKDREKFLSGEYGIGGSYGDRIMEEHSGKGLLIGGGLDSCGSGTLLTWSKVADRIDDLIRENRYLSRQEIKKLDLYEKQIVIRNIKFFFSSKSAETPRPYPADRDSSDDLSGVLLPQLENPERVQEIVSMMQDAFNIEMPGSRYYEQDRNNLQTVKAFAEGTFNLFPGSPYRPERLKTSSSEPSAAEVEPENPPIVPEEIPIPEYAVSLGTEVCIGDTECTVISMEGDTVELFDGTLIPLELDRKTFFRRLSENPLNDFLKGSPKPEPKEIHVSRVGDFYEFFGEDAKTVANLLELTLTSRRMPDDTRTPMCGIPFHKRDPYFQQLSDAGYAVTEVAPPWEEPQPDPDDLEAEQAINRHEAEYGADGFRAFRDEERIREAEASMPIALEAPKEPEQSPPEPPQPPMRGERRDYRIPSDQIGVGTPGERYENNVRAIRLLKALENENRLATAEEQEILARYVGWGGLADAFEEGNRHYGELKDLLTEEEYQAAKESTLTAFYTPPVVIDAVWRALGNMGFVRGNVLEPSCGVGNFMGRLPDGMKDAKIYGVELDRISGRIAKQLYQNQQITVTGFEKTSYPRNFFDLAVGNVPFGNFGVSDPNYDKFRFLIHDYFFAKALDQVRPGGIVAFVTAKGTMDKKDNTVRKYLAERAELLGAIRLPDSTFRGAAGTEVVSDILFLQKRDHMTALEPDWVHLGTDPNGFPINSYFVDHPEMIAGEMTVRSGPFGPESTCRLPDGETLADRLSAAVAHLRGEIAARGEEDLSEEEPNERIPADPAVRNFSFTLVDGKIYYRENSVMNPVKTSQTGENRVRGMIALRDTVRELIDAQLRGAGDGEVHDLQARLNRQYDNFTKKYGIINSRGNENAFSDDSSYFLLCSLEILDDDKQFEKKADLFTKRTINPERTVDHVDTAAEALAVSIGERAAIDMEWMGQLLGGRSEEELYADLRGVIFLNPAYADDPTVPKYLMADEYLSGNVREKLQAARAAAEKNPDAFSVHVEALERVQPADLTATEIGVRLGSTWIPERFVQQFMKELLDLSLSYYFEPKVKYIPELARWVISNKSSYYGNIKINNTYGTKRINAFEIIEETLNLRDVRIVDYEEDEGGKKKPILNKKETAIAQGKQDQIKRAFEDWIWKDRTRRETLCRLYNDRFNSIRPRTFDGSHIRFSGMSPEITLRRHQVNAVARILYGGNTLLAHVVGAGKTYTMVAAAQESRRLGLCNKSMFVVPNHLIEQWASEYLQLYPAANILVANKKDFETKNRKKFCARIATGDYDAVIIGHSQFEKIPMSVERQMEMIQDEINGIVESIEKVKFDRGERVTVKQLERTKKQLQLKLDKLNSQERKDDVVTFEQLGVDRLFIDEAHFYKNLFLFTKMRNVAGIAQTEAQKSSDLYLKCRYLDEQTGGRGVVFATGTPISNSMVELYTMQRYLQYDALRQNGLEQFDAWASTFGETVTAIELSPDGSGYRTKTRFAKFFNIPELMSLFRQVADVQTADMLNLPVPVAHYSVEKVAASEIQKDLVKSFADRAALVHNRMVPANEDNMLLITNDGRKTALDQRLINPLLSDEEGSKVNACVRNVYEIWERTAENKSVQMVFCDLSTPKGDGTFNVYDDIRGKLVAKGIPAEEIAFIHSADTDAKKKELFRKVRSGQVRVLMGSTFKMGAGTNVQKRLIALHDLDCPWRPSDLEQRAGRIVRQGNDNPEVDIIRYITEGTFDAYSYQLLESKQKFISQIMTSKTPVRVAEDVDETALSYAEIKALASGNPKIMEKMQLDADVGKLKLQKASHLSQRYALEDDLSKKFPKEIAETESYIRGYEADRKTVAEHTVPGEKGFSPMTIETTVFSVKAEAGKRILELCKTKTDPAPQEIGSYRGMGMKLGFDQSEKEFYIYLTGKLTHRVPLGQDANGIITRLDNSIDSMETRQKNCEARLADLCRQVETAKEEINAPFPDEELLQEKCRRLDELNAELNLDRTENELAEDEEEKEESEAERSAVCEER